MAPRTAESRGARLAALRAENDELRQRLEEAEQTLEAIRKGQVDSLVVDGPEGALVYSLDSASSSYRVLVEAMSQAATTLSGGGAILYCNARFAQMVGAPLEQVMGTQLRDWVPDSLRPEVDALLRSAGEGDVHRELSLVRRGGGEVPVYVSMSMIPGGKTFCAVLTDLTERRHAEEALRLAGIGSLTAGVAHEINNPLAYVLSNLDFVRERARALRSQAGDLPARVVNDLAEMEEAASDAESGAQRVREIVSDLKTFSRAPEEASPRPVDVRKAVASAITLAANEIRHRARLVTHLDPVPRVLGNERRLAQVFLNLLLNAAQAIPDGHAADHEIGVSTRAAGGEVVVEVRDTGSGIGPEARARLFEPFFTTKPMGTGTGLGLSISHGIVASYGGRIEVESAPGRGSTFRVILPATAIREATPPLRDTAPTAAPGRILVVDDDANVGGAIVRLLRGVHEVQTAVDPREALARIGAGGGIDLVLCDLMMPQMSGMEFQERLAEISPGLARTMVFMTGGAFSDAARRFLEDSRNACLDKPFDAETLRRVVAEAMATAPCGPR